MDDKNPLKAGYVQYEVQEDIGTITFFHPAHNSLPGHLLAQLAETIRRAGEDAKSTVLILQSAGDRTFCAGASFDELVAIEDETSGKRFFMGFANVINACRKCPKLIIGRVQGKAVGGGVGVASATDFCYATRFAAVKLSELALGIGPFVVGPAVARKIGMSAMSQLAINASEWKPADWARDKGLYADIFDTADELDKAVQALARRLAQSNPEAMRLLKSTVWEHTDHWDSLLEERASMSGQLVLSRFTREAIQRFKATK